MGFPVYSWVAYLELVNSNGAVIVGINGLEELPQALDLLRGQAARYHHEGCLLQLGHASKLQTTLRVRVKFKLWSKRHQVLHMLKKLSDL